MLDQDLIPQSHLWSLGILIAERSIDALFIPPVATDEIIFRSIPLDPAASSHLKAVEDAVYDNPLLLNVFRRVTVAIDTDRFTLLPHGLDESTLALRAIELTSDLPLSTRPNIVRATGIDNLSLMMDVDSDFTGFIRRTFFNVNLTHPLAPLISYLTDGADNRPAVTASLRNGRRLDIVATDSSRLLMANTLTYEAPADAAYFILASRAASGINPSAPVFIAAPPEEREFIASLLHQALPDLDIPPSFPCPAELWRSGSSLASAPLSLTLTSL